MKLKVQRKIQFLDCTKGAMSIDGLPECVTLEDVHHDVKIFGVTRIPAGIYKLRLNTTGGMNKRSPYVGYDWHKGMIELVGVPGYDCVYIHIGNYAKDTLGCVLVGRADVVGQAMISGSVFAYEKFYKKVVLALLRGEESTIEICDELKVA